MQNRPGFGNAWRPAAAERDRVALCPGQGTEGFRSAASGRQAERDTRRWLAVRVLRSQAIRPRTDSANPLRHRQTELRPIPIIGQTRSGRSAVLQHLSNPTQTLNLRLRTDVDAPRGSVLPSFCRFRRGVRKDSGKVRTLSKRIHVVRAGFVCCFPTERDSPALMRTFRLTSPSIRGASHECVQGILPSAGASRTRGQGAVHRRDAGTLLNDPEKSDPRIVATKPTNKAGRARANLLALGCAVSRARIENGDRHCGRIDCRQSLLQLPDRIKAKGTSYGLAALALRGEGCCDRGIGRRD
jgi:hypothetical protein